jgi:hypothetical protein
MAGLKLEGPGGEALAEQSGLNSSLSIAENIWVVAGMLVFIRFCSFVALHLAYRLNWL